MLLVDHGQPERVEGDVVGEERLGPHDDVHAAVGEPLDDRAAVRGRTRRGQQGHPHRSSTTKDRFIGDLERSEQRRDGLVVLFGEHLGRRHQRPLVSTLHDAQQRRHRHHRLA